jgi:peptidyl-prolyl cis-trans isomerase A (cyclophilin A)
MKTAALFALAAMITGATLEVNAKPIAIFHTEKGDFTVELYPDKAPKTVENFIGLATGSKTWQHPETREAMTSKPLYNNVKFHRTMAGFMIQGGDPLGTGTGGPGFRIPDEFHDLKFDREGRLAMANTGQPNSGGSQFFVTVAPRMELHQVGNYTIFGQVTKGMDVVKAISVLPSEPGSGKALQPVTIKSIEIVQEGAQSTAAADNKSTTAK